VEQELVRRKSKKKSAPIELSGYDQMKLSHCALPNCKLWKFFLAFLLL